MAVNKLLPFANGDSANVIDYATWSALTQILGQGFVTGVARSDYANRLFSQGALASYILGQFVVEQTAQDADLDESVFYTNFKNALVSYIKANAVSLDTAQTVGGVKTFTSSPLVPTADAADTSQKVANTAFVQGEIASKANASEVVKLTGNQTIAGTKTFSDSPEVPTPASGDNSQKTASTGFVQNAVATQGVKFDSVQTLTDAEKTQARTNIGAPADSEVVKLTNSQTVSGDKNFTGLLQHSGNAVDSVVASGSGYIRYESGWQICWGSASATPVATSSWGNVFYNENTGIQVTFPVPFIEAPSVSVSQNRNLSIWSFCIITVECTATGITRVGIMRGTSMNDKVGVGYIAIGRWK